MRWRFGNWGKGGWEKYVDGVFGVSYNDGM